MKDAHLLLHETTAVLQLSGRCLWQAMGDFVKAFPQTWRADLLLLLSDGPGVRGGALVLLHNIFAADVVHVWLSGEGKVEIKRGIPEGGTLGCLAYTTLPDSLVRALLEADWGVGIDVEMPRCWQCHKWRGSGSPDGALVASLRRALRDRSGPPSLPSQELLETWPDLEASALRALDLEASTRLVAVLHADDPVFLASSRAALSGTLRDVSAWAAQHQASFHVGPTKTVVLCTDARGRDEPPEGDILFDAGDRSGGVILHKVLSHRWIGAVWDSRLYFAADLHAKLGLARAAFSTLLGMVNSRVAPLPTALILFNLKVDSVLAHTRWLWIMLPAAQSVLDDQYQSWARALLGADAWRNAAVATSEVGWPLGGFARLVRATALRRAKLWTLPEQDVYRAAFERANSLECGWAARSGQVLRQYGVSDWPVWQPSGIRAKSLTNYRSYVLSRLMEASRTDWTAVASQHNAQVPYLRFRKARCVVMRTLARSRLRWNCLVGVRAWCRLRAGLVVLRHSQRRISRARFQQCIFCHAIVRNATVHVLGKCVFWHEHRAVLQLSPALLVSPDKVAIFFLGCSTVSPLFPLVVRMADEIDTTPAAFWSKA